MASSGVVSETTPWHPWYAQKGDSSPAGYATGYTHNFQFVTIRLAGHQVCCVKKNAFSTESAIGMKE
jgi:hypothetical protein